MRGVREYCESFYEWKKLFELRRHWQVYKRKDCRPLGHKLKREKMGVGKRSTFFCPICQKKSLSAERIVLNEVMPIAVKGKKEKRLDH